MSYLLFYLLLPIALFTAAHPLAQPPENTAPADTLTADISTYQANFGRQFIEEWTRKNGGEDQGNPYLADYQSPLKYGNQNLDIAINHKNLVFLANRRGVQIFDGRNWQRVQLPFLVYKLERRNKRIYLGGDNNFGYIARADSGSYYFRSLKKKGRDVGIIDKISTGKKHVFFGGYKALIRYTPSTEAKGTYIDSEPVFNGMFAYRDTAYVNIKGTGLWKFPERLLREKGDTMFINGMDKLPFRQLIRFSNDTLDFSSQEILFASRLDTGRMLIGTDASVLYAFNGDSLELYPIEAGPFIRKSILTDGTRLSDQTFALATRTGGCIVVESQKGRTLRTINYQTGLADDEVQALATDYNTGLWLVHAYGISRADFRLPVRDFSHIPGLEGTNTGMFKYKNRLFVATSQGLFYKDRVKNFREIRQLVRVKKNRGQEEQEQEEEQSFWDRIFNRRKQEEEKTEKEKEGLLKRFFDRLTGKDKEDKNGEKEKPQQPQPSKKDKNYAYKVRKTYALQSIRHRFRQVENMEAKVLDTKIVDEQLLIATNKGLYHLKEDRAVPLIENVYIYRIALALSDKGAWIASREGFYLVRFQNGKWRTAIAYQMEKPVYSIVEVKSGTCWLGTDNLAAKVRVSSRDSVKKVRSYQVKAPFSERIHVMRPSPGEVLIVADEVLQYKAQEDTLVKYSRTGFNKKQRGSLLNTQDSLVWRLSDKGWHLMNYRDYVTDHQLMYLDIFNRVKDLYVDRDSNLWLIAKDKGLFKIEHTSYFNPESRKFRIYINKIQDKTGAHTSLSGFRLNYQRNALTIQAGAPFYLRSDKVEFQYKVEGLSDNWSEWRRNPVIEFPFIPYGNYTLKIRGKNLFEQVSPVQKVPFTISAPFWLRWWFIVLAVLFVVLVAGFIIHLRMRRLRRENLRLEQKVQERTREIKKQQEQITESIQYGKRIQTAMLPPEGLIQRNDIEYFIYYRPRDIVSGDFYWYSQHHNKTFFAAVDCTGHGVPGAFLSMLGMAFLNEIVNERKIIQPNKVLDELRDYVIKSLRQTGNKQEQQDGMDMAFVRLDHDNLRLEFAGAYSPLYLVRKEKLTSYRGNRMPVAIYHGNTRAFTNHSLDLHRGDVLYIFSDGFSDQIGGNKRRKYMAGRMKRFLVSIHQKSAKEQKKLLEQEFLQWKGEQQQIDDVLVMGIKIK